MADLLNIHNMLAFGDICVQLDVAPAQQRSKPPT
jgi:hypothetical protein